jgi:hypothetical protein
MPLSPRTQDILLLIGIPCVIAVGFAVTSGNAIAAIACLILLPNALACLLGWGMYNGLRTGTIKTRAGPVGRNEQPRSYWIAFAFLTFFLGVTLLAAGIIDFAFLSGTMRSPTSSAA